jgi:hypothetical protein
MLKQHASPRAHRRSMRLSIHPLCAGLSVRPRFAKITLGPHCKKSRVIYRNRHPMWQQRCATSPYQGPLKTQLLSTAASTCTKPAGQQPGPPHKAQSSSERPMRLTRHIIPLPLPRRMSYVAFCNCVTPCDPSSLLFPLESLGEGEPLLVEMWDKDFAGIEFLGQVSAWFIGWGMQGREKRGRLVDATQTLRRRRHPQAVTSPTPGCGSAHGLLSLARVARRGVSITRGCCVCNNRAPSGDHDAGQGAGDRAGPNHRPRLLVSRGRRPTRTARRWQQGGGGKAGITAAPLGQCPRNSRQNF